MAKTKTKALARRAPAKKTTALARRLPSTVAKSALSSTPANGYIVAADGSLQLGALGLVELKLTAKEESVLAERAPAERIEWKPRVKGGPPEIPYLPHHVYTDWFNRAFGRTGWQLVPIGKPMPTDKNTVLLPYVLHIHAKPVAFAWGEQEYFPDNRQQTYGDVIESTVASALRRCAKHLGVGLEMWDRTFLRRLPKPAHEGSVAEPPRQPPAARSYQPPVEETRPQATHSASNARISDRQQKRLWMIVKNSGRDEQSVRDWIARRFNYNGFGDITRDVYDYICASVESPADLPGGR